MRCLGHAGPFPTVGVNNPQARTCCQNRGFEDWGFGLIKQLQRDGTYPETTEHMHVMLRDNDGWPAAAAGRKQSPAGKLGNYKTD